jgi:hypothetical protein
MKLFLFSSLIGASIGGIPGAFLAFFIAAGTGSGEVVCYLFNLVLSVGGAFARLLVTKAIHGKQKNRVVEVGLAVVFGLLFGTGGYLWLDSAISHAEPPL